MPLKSSLHPPQDEYEYEPGTPLPADSDVEPDAPQEPVFPDLKLTPKGEIIPAGFHWDGHRIVRNYKGSKRPAEIDSELWKMLGPQDRKLIIEEEAKKAAKEQEEKPAPSSGSKGKKKKSSPVRLEATQCPPATARLVGNAWEIIPAASQKFSAPVMPKTAAPATIEHRPRIRELVKEKIKELEFKVALELFASVARLVSKDEIASNPKAKTALDKEWEILRNKGVWDEKRVRECRDIVAEARRNGQTVHLGRIFEACYEKGSELPESDPRRKFKGIGQSFKETMSEMRIPIMHSLMS